MNLISDTIVLDKSCNLTTSSKNILATLEVSVIIEQGRNWAILEKRFTTTKTELRFLKVFGKPSMKSTTSYQGQFGTRSGVYKSMFCFLFLAS